jgi:serine-type D-Ala-D-Ala carboxypeptidase (penicillin-binding protein 5/6)
MGRRWPAALAALMAGAVLLAPGAAADDDARPTADPGAPTPTAPYTRLPPQGHAPDGETVGGDELDDRGIVVSDDAPPLPAGIAATGWLVADADSGEVLAAHDAHRRLPPASTLKTLFALTVLPTLPGGIRHRVREEELAGIGAGSSMVGVAEGHTYTVADLWRGVFLNSGNDAVHALARTDAGGVPATIRRMKAKAAELGALDTTVTDPTGLDADGQLSSAYDLALIARAGLQRKDFSRYAATRISYYPMRAGGRYQISNQNQLLFSYPGALGVKTGFTTLARNTFVGAAQRDGHRLVVTLLNSPHGVTQDAAALLDWTFANRATLDGIGTLVTPAEVARIRPAAPATTEVPDPVEPAGTAAKPGLTADGPLRVVQTTVARLPLWAYGVPPLLLVLTWMRPRPKARRAKARRARR